VGVAGPGNRPPAPGQVARAGGSQRPARPGLVLSALILVAPKHVNETTGPVDNLGGRAQGNRGCGHFRSLRS